MNIGFMVVEIPLVANSMIGKPALPDFLTAAENGAKSVRISSFDELYCVFERNLIGRGQQEMNMFRHHDKSVKLEAALASIAINRLQK